MNSRFGLFIVFAPLMITSAQEAGLRNADATYQKLRDAGVAESFVAEGITLQRDCATLHLKQGIISFAAPQMGKVTLAVFTGTGEFSLDPVAPIEKGYLKLVSGSETVQETFTQAVFVFTDSTYDEIKRNVKTLVPDPRALEALRQHRSRVRKRNEIPRSFSEAMLTSEQMDNLEADVLAWLYNPSRPAMFNAFIQGQKRKDLRFYMRGTGAVPELYSPEAVALVNVDPSENADGIWYQSHQREEVVAGGYAISKDTRAVQPISYAIETTLEGTRRMAAKARVELRCLLEGERLIKFGLLQDLRVDSVVDGAGQPVVFIQEDKKTDGSFYVVLPKGLRKGEQATLTISYAGDKVLTDAGGGSTYVSARSSWYPSLNSFQDRALYDLTFKAPKRYTVVASGRKVKTWEEGKFTCTQWRGNEPHTVAGFNVGVYKAKAITDQRTGTQIEGYATTEAPGYLRRPDGSSNIAPSALLDMAMSQAQVSLQLFTHWFGELPYKHISVTQQPNFSMGQSWPELVYLPLSAFLDSTTRVQLMGGINNRLTDFVSVVTAHEVSHQWWGHLVGWQTYRDQWLSEGLATFSAGLFLEATEKNRKPYLEYWEKARTSLLEKNEFGMRSVDAGPIYLGLRASTKKTMGAYQDLTYLKSGYVFHMLRMMMADPQTGDAGFIAMMKDFVQTHKNQNATLTSFAAVLERHIKPHMDLTGTGSMGWFMRQWLLETDVPRYELQWDAQPSGDGFLFKAKVTQSEVGDNFAMPVPIYLEHQDRLIRLGRVTLIGRQSKDVAVKLPFKPSKALLNANYDILEQK
jgi:hypothetical protein